MSVRFILLLNFLILLQGLLKGHLQPYQRPMSGYSHYQDYHGSSPNLSAPQYNHHLQQRRHQANNHDYYSQYHQQYHGSSPNLHSEPLYSRD